MLRKIFVPFMLFVLCAFWLAACGGSDTTTDNGNSTTTNVNKTTTTTTTTTTSSPATTSSSPAMTSSPAKTTTASGDKIGVPECDDFLAKYDACVSSKVPEAARAQYKASLEQWRKSWRDLAANPQTKGTLAQACKTSAEQARQSMKSFNCEF
jgi:hypothetical protein